MSEFTKELKDLINKHGMEIGSHTPDFILATYLTNCLAAFDIALESRRKWYVRDESQSATKEFTKNETQGDTQ